MRALVGLAQSRTREELLEVTTAQRELLRARGDTELTRAFVEWIQQHASRLDPAGTEVELGKTLEEAMTTLGERWAAEWSKEWVQKGRQEGLAEGRREGVVQGREEGVERERDLLRRLAALRFGGEVGEQAKALLAETDDWDRLAEGGELIVRAESGAELLRSMVAIVRPST